MLAIMTEITVRPATETDLPALVAIMALAGEHMHRVQGLSYWYPFPPTELYSERAAGRQTYAVDTEGLLVATFDLSTRPERYHRMELWPDGDVLAVYFGGFAVLPAYWGQGIGSAVVATAEGIATAAGHRHFRFDAASSNDKLIAWYRSLGFEPTGVIDLGTVAVTCFEKLLGGVSG